jgi:hypothetical protein
VRRTDRIITIERGCLVEDGAHDVRVKTGGRYASLHRLQAGQELVVQKSKTGEADAAVAAIVQARAQTDAEYRRTLFGELAEAQRKAAGLREDLIKATRRT